MVFIYIHITDSLSEWNMENIIFWEVHIWEPHQGSCKLDELLCSPGSPTSTSIMTWPLWPFLRIPCACLVANPTFQLAMSMLLRTFIVWKLLPLPKKCKTKTRHRFWLFSAWLCGPKIRGEICPSRTSIMFNCFVIIFASYGYLYMGSRTGI